MAMNSWTRTPSLVNQAHSYYLELVVKVVRENRLRLKSAQARR
jgi:hypothetical protein